MSRCIRPTRSNHRRCELSNNHPFLCHPHERIRQLCDPIQVPRERLELTILQVAVDIYQPQFLFNSSQKYYRNVSPPIHTRPTSNKSIRPGILTKRVVALYNGELWVKRASWALFFVSYVLCIVGTSFATKFNVGPCPVFFFSWHARILSYASQSENVQISLIGGVCSVTGAPKLFALIFVSPVGDRFGSDA